MAGSPSGKTGQKLMGGGSTVVSVDAPEGPDRRLCGKKRRWQLTVFVLCWLSYVMFYFTRKPLAVTKAVLEKDLKLSTDWLGRLDTAWLTAYALGQFVSGPMSDTMGPKVVLLTGMSGSVICCLCFTAIPHVASLTFFWFVNGLCHACGFPAIMKCLHSWFGPAERGA
eukprot:RCo048337